MVEQATTQEEQHLRLLAVFYYVLGGISALFACFPFIHFFIGLFFLGLGLGSGTAEMLPFAGIGLFFTLIAGTIIFVGMSFALCLILTGRFLTAKEHYMFCLVMAGISCAIMPLGTILGVFTMITITKPQVKEMFEHS
jgi:hypothetical protein